MNLRLQTAERLLEQKLFANAEELYQDVYDSEQEPEALYGLALCAYYQKDYQSALNNLNELLKVNSTHARAFNQTGIISVEVGDLETAQTMFVAAIRCDPTLVAAQRNYAWVLLESGDFENGIQTYMKIIENHPDDVPALLRMAELFEEVGRNEDAGILAKKVLDIDSVNGSAKDLLTRIGTNSAALQG